MLMGIFNILGSLLGLPFVTGSLPHSPQFVTALRDDSGHVHENRVAPFLMYLLIGLSLVGFPHVVELIPIAAVNGILIVVGVAGLFGCQLWQRLWLLLTPSQCYDHGPTTPYTNAPAPKMHLFTFLQVLAKAWAVHSIQFQYRVLILG